MQRKKKLPSIDNFPILSAQERIGKAVVQFTSTKIGGKGATSDNVHFCSDKKENIVNGFLQVKNVEVYSTVLATSPPSEKHR